MADNRYVRVRNPNQEDYFIIEGDLNKLGKTAILDTVMHRTYKLKIGRAHV